MKKLISYIIVTILFLPLTTGASEGYLFNNFESSPDATQIEFIKDTKTRYCEQTYLEAMRRRDFTRYELRVCKDIFIKKIRAEIEYKRRVMQERYIY